MTLKDFMKETNNRAGRFDKYWTLMHEQNPESFPLDMLSGDWDEQFRLFCEVTNGNPKWDTNSKA